MIVLLYFFPTLFLPPFKSRSRLEAENAALQHQLNILSIFRQSLDLPRVVF
jgi:hypothetical protein